MERCTTQVCTIVLHGMKRHGTLCLVGTSGPTRQEETPMATPMQTLPAATDTPAERPCFWCNRSGRVPNDDEQRYDACSACEGSGLGAAPQLGDLLAA